MTPTAAAAHAWAAETRALRDALGAAMEAGTINRAAAPEEIFQTLQTILDEVDRLPPDGPLSPLVATTSSQFPAWVHYHRVVRAWVAALADAGKLSHFNDGDAAAFEAWLFRAGEASATAGG